ncbi:hypothetical protein DH2020_020962 [Rehmannia glutinosa]|uniref:Protein FAR1-RELATED SEQUENCE n=1 Tax=Rehmannia glutinosa TaxID=99300 RepID=A0ABR0W9S7_REHGL
MDVELIGVDEGNMGQRGGITDDGDDDSNSGGEMDAFEHSLVQDDDGIFPEPHVGMEFDSENAAKMFYEDYARHVGFSTRVQFDRSKVDGMPAYREFLCSRDGLKKRAGDSCEAMLRIELRSEHKWVVTKFVKEHSHTIVNHSKLHCLRPKRHFAATTNSVAEGLQGMDVVPSGVMYVSMDGNSVPAEMNHVGKNMFASGLNHTLTDISSLGYTPGYSSRRRTLGQARMARVCLAHPNFQVELYNCINMTETIEEFESFWCSILDKYDLKKNDWLQSIYDARRQWVPVYFRDSFFAAFPSLGLESSFFDGYVNQQTTLPMFFRQYERALENSFEREVDADFDTICTTPVLRTPSPMEKQAANLYTKRIFSRFQEELVETFVYTANRVDGDRHNSTYRVAKFEDDHKAYFVSLNIAEMKASCSCRMFEYSGILCRHVLTVFTVTNVLTLPSHYILKRWTRNAKSIIVADDRSEPQGHESLTTRYNNLCKEAIRFAEEGAVASETYSAAFVSLREGAKKVAGVKKSVAKVAPSSSQVNGVGYDDRRTSIANPEMTPLLWPRQDEIIRRFNLNDAGVPSQPISDSNVPRMAPVSLNRDGGHTDNMLMLPSLKSMTWVMENKNLTPANRVAVINLKLQDYGKTPAGESEVKFSLSRVTLEPMLRSMAYISEQLSTPANKVAVINLKLQDMETTSGESEVKFQVSRDTLGAMLRSMAYIREQLSNAIEPRQDNPAKRPRK